jgi:hypothetical protein
LLRDLSAKISPLSKQVARFAGVITFDALA